MTHSMVAVMKRILIVEAATEAAAGLSAVAAKAFPSAELVRVRCAADALRRIEKQVFELALVDPHRLEDDGLSVVQALKPRAVVVLTEADDDAQLLPALRAGVFGYLLKAQPQDALVAALRAITQGEPPLTPSIARRVLRFFSEGAPPAPWLAPKCDGVALNLRETDILLRVAKGFTLPEIAAQLSLSRHTVADYVKQIYRKLNVSSRAEAALEAARRGLVRP